MIATNLETIIGILNQLSESVQICDENGCLLYCNHKTGEILGYSTEELIKKPVTTFNSNFPSINAWQDFFTTIPIGNTINKNCQLLSKSSTLIPVEASITKRVIDGKQVAISVFRDLTHETQIIAKQNTAMGIIKTSVRISEYLLNNDHPENAIHYALKLLGKTVQVDRVHIFENYWNNSEDCLYSTLKYEWVNQGISEQINNPTLKHFCFQKDAPLLFNPLNHGSIFNMQVKDMPNDLQPEFKNQGVISILLIPIRIKERFWGIIGFDSCTREREWSEDEISFLKITANTLGMYIEKQESFSSLENLVKEKEILLSELHHRTKNNLAIISGIIDLQNGFTNNPEVLSYSETIRERIQNIALIHEILSSTGKFSQLSFSQYLDLLIRRLETTFMEGKTLSKTIQIVDFIITDLSQMVSIGILLNEILLNAFKHAFKSSEHPELYIEAGKWKHGIYIRIKDNGPGFISNLDSDATNSTAGMKIIRGLLDQLRAKLTLNTQNGAEYLIELETLKTLPS